MRYIATMFLALIATASAQQPDNHQSTDSNLACAKLAKIAYQPPNNLILLATKGLEELQDRQPSTTMSSKQYNRELKLILTVGTDGLIRDISFAESSGNRLVDRAARNWAFGHMFAPIDCGNALQYKIWLPIVISAHTGGA
jgi:hypothetical protein